jgi:hypothetical protein
MDTSSADPLVITTAATRGEHVARQSGWQRDNQDGKFFDRSITEAFGSDLIG